jgi:hypothetical protein
VPELHHPRGEVQIIACGIRGDKKSIEEFDLKREEHVITATTKEIEVLPDKTVIRCGESDSI